MVSDKVYRRMQLSCSCGHVSRNMAEEARHRHNFPFFCKKPKPKAEQCIGETADKRRCKRRTTSEFGFCHSHGIET